MRRLTVPLLMSALLLAGCGGRFSDSGWNPLRWMDRGQRAPQTLAPDGGYGLAGDERPSVPQLLGVRWEPLNEGRLLVVTGIGPTKGYFDAELITAVAQPEGRISPDPDGVLRLRFVALPPPPTPRRHGCRPIRRWTRSRWRCRCPTPNWPLSSGSRSAVLRICWASHAENGCTAAAVRLIRSGRRSGRVV